ncbi:MAG: Alpha/Beta hydrolase protein [Linnemannia elongata]|nr:MAG: Alpha/Beta hydrolase protein [Linnemannia elongata]
MQRSNSTGNKLPFLRRQSTAAPLPVPYANPAATQFLRLGVGIDHVDVDQSDDEDVIYQGIENGMEGHDGDVLDTSDEEERESDGDEEEDEQGDHADNDSDNNDDNVNRKRELLQQTQQPLQTGIQEQEQQKQQLQQQQAALSNNNDDNIRTHKPQLSINATAISAQAQPSSTASYSSSAVPASMTIYDPPSTTMATAVPTSPPKGPYPPRLLTKIDTQLRHKGETSPSSNDPSQPISPQHLQGPASPRSPTSPSHALPKGLPVYHEKFTKAASTKIHGASPLSNVNNAVSANTSSSNETKPTSPRRRSTHAHQLTETILAPGTEDTPISTATASIPAPYLQVKRFPEQVGFATIHNWKVHYKICYPTLDPAYRINGNGRNIVLFHGALSNLGTWRKVQQTLADRTGCRVLSYDRMGHGLSDKPEKWPKNANPYKNGGVLAICQALLDTLGMENNLILIGNGTGGTIASAIALSKPMSARGLILLAPAIQDEAPPLYLRACVSYPPPLSWIYRGLYGDHGPLQQYYYKPKAIMAEPSTVEMYMKPHKEEGFWRGLSNATKYRSSYKVEKHLDQLTELSTLVMTGDVDDVVPTIETLRLFETLQSVRKLNVPQVLKIIKHAGHLPQEEKPIDVVKVISFFVKKVCLGSVSRERSLGRRMSEGVQRSSSKKSVKAATAEANNRAITDANTQANAQVIPPSVGPGPAVGKGGAAQSRLRPGQGPRPNMAPAARADLPVRGSPAITVNPALGYANQAIKSH